MSQETENKIQIGDHEFIMYMMPPMASHKLLLEVVKMLGPSLGPLFDMFQKKAKESGKPVMDLNLDADFFSKAAAGLFGSLDGAVLDRVIQSFVDVTHYKGAPLSKTFDVIFRGNLDIMYSWIVWGMKVQWGKSLTALGGKLGTLSGKVTAPSL